MPKNPDDKVKAVDKRGRKVYVPRRWLDMKSLGFRTPPSQKKPKRAAADINKPKGAEAVAEANDSKEETK